MAVVIIKEDPAARKASVNEKHERNYSRKFLVRTNDRNDGPATVGGAVGIPKLFDVYATPNETDLGARVISITPQQVADSLYDWEVDIEYSSTAKDKNDDPLQRPAEVSWSFAQFQRVAERDINGQAVLNSSGQYFDPPVEIDDSRPVLTITRNEPTFIPSIAIDYQDAVNEDPFFGFPPNTVKVAGISASNQIENDIPFWKITYEFHLSREGWTKQILDQGRYEKGNVPIPEKDKNGTDIKESHVTDPVPLDGTGKAVPSPNPTNVTYLPFDVYKKRPFFPLALI